MTSVRSTIITTTDNPEAEQHIVTAVRNSLQAEVRAETIMSYYWWDGKVQNDAERRLSFDTSHAFETAMDVVSKAHNYDVPMIITAVSEGGEHWKGTIAPATAELAAALAGSRLVACAQLDADGSLAVKTTAEAKV
eukprot:CAMPEP_0119321648 /NCGR_PEP_ID=MMETSP1333-20130426/55978_1 /TAXON_ID=418940 /ORGANISM="Scyphosphaera apsteinii, Strain RCC1455" /LENGTH=135 /DNA_ID=CAMNT_0007328661 /DNA_START=107 /DNA_END=511 /DNA_ORIENTATION=+